MAGNKKGEKKIVKGRHEIDLLIDSAAAARGERGKSAKQNRKRIMRKEGKKKNVIKFILLLRKAAINNFIDCANLRS